MSNYVKLHKWTFKPCRDWQQREHFLNSMLKERFYIPEDAPVLAGHPTAFATPDGLISFWDEKAQRYQKMRYGRYLTTYYPKMSDKDVKKWVDYWRVNTQDIEVRFARTAEEIVAVYINGPESCMSMAGEEYGCEGHHPCEVYGNSDFCVAYFMVENKVKARTLVSEKLKKYSFGVYGDHLRLTHELEKMGYTQTLKKEFKGHEIHAIKLGTYGDKYVMPFIDGGYCVKLSGDKFVLTDSNDENGYDWCADETDGVAYL